MKQPSRLTWSRRSWAPPPSGVDSHGPETIVHERSGVAGFVLAPRTPLLAFTLWTVGYLVATGTVLGCAQVQDLGSTALTASTGAPSQSSTGSGGGEPVSSTATTTASASASASTGASSQSSTGSGGGEPISCVNGQQACDGACRDLTNDPDHCGACGRSCLGEACGDGQCPTTTLLQEYQFHFSSPPTFLAVDDQFLFWTNRGRNYDHGSSVCRANLDGSAPINLSSSSDHEPDGHLAIDATHVYWASSSGETSGSVVRIPRLGGSPSALVTLPTLRPNGIALDTASHSLFVASYGIGQDPAVQPSIVAAASTNGAFAGIKQVGTVGAKFLEGIAVDATYVYTTARDLGFVFRTPRVGGVSEPIAVGFVAPIAVVIDGADAYVLDGGLSFPSTPGAVARVHLATGVTELLATGLASPFDLAVDDANVYVTVQGTNYLSVSDGAVVRIPKQGGPAITLAGAQSNPLGIALHGKYVYWVNHGTFSAPSAILRTAR